MRAALCSRNAGKLRELRAALPGWEIELLEADEYPPEEGATFYENALGKARFGRQVAPPGTWTLGEDSGIEVDGLGGAPGVQSARWAAGDEVGTMLRALAGMDGDARRARYRCELVALSPEGTELRAAGVLEGRIAEQARGNEGFGYDPVFVPEGEQRTVAELGDEWKREHSHRARAARALREAAEPRR